jgi:hypothetical protein
MRTQTLFVLVVGAAALVGCSRGSAGKPAGPDPAAEVTAVVPMTREQLTKKLVDTAHPNYRGDKPGSTEGAVLLINSLGKLLGTDSFKAVIRDGKRFLVVQCTDGVAQVEVLGEMAINDQPALMVGKTTHR